MHGAGAPRSWPSSSRRLHNAAMIKLARAMEFRVVAEQVERQEDFDWLREVGVDYVQGFAIGQPFVMAPRFPKAAGSDTLSAQVQAHAG